MKNEEKLLLEKEIRDMVLRAEDLGIDKEELIALIEERMDDNA